MRYSSKIKAILVFLKNVDDKNEKMDYINNIQLHSSVHSWISL
jgi:hypothetical protein